MDQLIDIVGFRKFNLYVYRLFGLQCCTRGNKLLFNTLTRLQRTQLSNETKGKEIGLC